MSDLDTIRANVSRVAAEFARDRAARQQRRDLVAADFDALRDAGLHRIGVPVEHGGVFASVAASTRPICDALRALAGGDPSVALVCSMHPAVLSYWMTTPRVDAAAQDAWDRQRAEVFAGALDGAWWGTITSEPGSGGDVALTKATAARDGDGWALSGAKHFGSGSGVTSFMVTTAVPEGEAEPDWFFLDVRGVPWDGSRGVTLLAAWDGQGMAATQSHAMRFDRFPATRLAWRGHRRDVSAAAGPLIGCLFASVIAGVVETAVAAARADLGRRRGTLRAYEQVEWTRAEADGWLVQQALDGMLRTIETGETGPATAHAVALGKLAIAELAESCLARICRVLGGGTFSRRSPYAHWFEDVRALGFLRPPWALAHDDVLATAW